MMIFGIENTQLGHIGLISEGHTNKIKKGYIC